MFERGAGEWDVGTFVSYAVKNSGRGVGEIHDSGVAGNTDRGDVGADVGGDNFVWRGFDRGGESSGVVGGECELLFHRGEHAGVVFDGERSGGDGVVAVI